MTVHDGADVPRAVEGLVGVEQHLRAPEAVIAVAEPWTFGEHVAGELPKRHPSGIGKVGKVAVSELLDRLDEDDSQRRDAGSGNGQRKQRHGHQPHPDQAGKHDHHDGERHQAGGGLGAGVGHEDQRGDQKKDTAIGPAPAQQIEPGEAEACHHRSGQVLVREQAAPQPCMLPLGRVGRVDRNVGQQNDADIAGDHHAYAGESDHRRKRVRVARQRQHGHDGDDADDREERCAGSSGRIGGVDDRKREEAEQQQPPRAEEHRDHPRLGEGQHGEQREAAKHAEAELVDDVAAAFRRGLGAARLERPEGDDCRRQQDRRQRSWRPLLPGRPRPASRRSVLFRLPILLIRVTEFREHAAHRDIDGIDGVRRRAGAGQAHEAAKRRGGEQREALGEDA